MPSNSPIADNSAASAVAIDAETAPEPAEDLLVEEVSIDGMCGVY